MECIEKLMVLLQYEKYFHKHISVSDGTNTVF